jgi:hypothetical protein
MQSFIIVLNLFTYEDDFILIVETMKPRHQWSSISATGSKAFAVTSASLGKGSGKKVHMIAMNI